MLYASVAGLRLCCIAAILLVATIQAGEPPHPLMGLTRDQIINRQGEPRSQMMAGGREVMFYPRERLFLTNGVVVEVERLTADLPRKAPAAEPSPRASAPPAGAAAKAGDGSEPEPQPAAAAARPAEPADAAVPAEAKLGIRLVRPSSGTTPGPASEPVSAVPSAPVANIPAGLPPIAPAVPATPSPRETAADSTKAPVAVAPAAPALTPAAKSAVTPPEAAAVPKVSRTQVATTPAPPPDSGLMGYLYVLGGALLVGAVGYLVWRSRQRQLELEATAVEATPVGAAAISRAAEAGFSAQFLASLDAPRFEELVAAYYVKTGVVATRVNDDPASPFQIRISWKGEARAFALVQCLAQPAEPIDPKPLMLLHTMLDKEKVRRGYVVTPGKFAAPAREFAEQKGLTLLPGDVFLEKLMALPDSARSELMRAITPKASG